MENSFRLSILQCKYQKCDCKRQNKIILTKLQSYLLVGFFGASWVTRVHWQH